MPPATAEADAIDAAVAQRTIGRRDGRWYIILTWIVVGGRLRLWDLTCNCRVVNGMFVGLLLAGAVSCRLWLFLTVVAHPITSRTDLSTTFTRNFNSHESNSTAHHRANLLGSPSASFCVAGCYYPRVTTKAIRFMYTSPFLSAPAGQFHPQPTNLHAPTSFILVIGPFFRSKIGHSRSESLSQVR